MILRNYDTQSTRCYFIAYTKISGLQLDSLAVNWLSDKNPVKHLQALKMFYSIP